MTHASPPQIQASPQAVDTQHLRHAKSQLGQDAFVLAHLNFKRHGFFVEFGATNGVDLSNTYLLEKAFGWTGILAEPARCWHPQLKRNRRAHIELSCIWRESGAVFPFNETSNADLSTLDAFSDSDDHRNHRRHGRLYDINTLSLNDFLAKYHAPRHIDYLSIDTEGSEFEILSHLDFNRYHIDIITCEHNFTPMRTALFDLLNRHGYDRVFPERSGHDDWYVKLR